MRAGVRVFGRMYLFRAIPFDTANWPGGTVERQFATNHLGPFLLTGLLQKVLESTPGARVINHSSSASDMTKRVSNVHEAADITKDAYDAWDSYASTKRANRYFTWSLNQRLSKDKGLFAVACHPGWTGTNLQHRSLGLAWLTFGMEAVYEKLTMVLNNAYSQPVSLGAQPQVFWATVLSRATVTCKHVTSCMYAPSHK